MPACARPRAQGRFFTVGAAVSAATSYGQITTMSSPDPWTAVTYSLDANGDFVLPSPDAVQVDGVTFSVDPCTNVNDHAVVVHSPDSTRVGCGVLGDDPWSGITVTSNAEGVVNSSVQVAGYAIDQVTGVSLLNSTGTAYNAYGRVIVVHNSDGTRIGCGCCIEEGASVVMNPYPNYDGALTVSGTVTVTSTSKPASLTLQSELGGLQANKEAGLHVHKGTSCDVAHDIGGHFFDEGVAVLSHYPEYTGDLSVSGVATVEAVANTVAISFSASLVDNSGTFEASSSGGVHIHTGTSCDDADSVGGHFYNPQCATTAAATTTTTATTAAAATVVPVTTTTAALAATTTTPTTTATTAAAATVVPATTTTAATAATTSTTAARTTPTLRSASTGSGDATTASLTAAVTWPEGQCSDYAPALTGQTCEYLIEDDPLTCGKAYVQGYCCNSCHNCSATCVANDATALAELQAAADVASSCDDNPPPDPGYSCEYLLSQNPSACNKEWMQGYCCNSCFECAEDCGATTTLKTTQPVCEDSSPPSSSYTCEYLSTGGSDATVGYCKKDWMQGYCCQSCHGCSAECLATTTTTQQPIITVPWLDTTTLSPLDIQDDDVTVSSVDDEDEDDDDGDDGDGGDGSGSSGGGDESISSFGANTSGNNTMQCADGFLGVCQYWQYVVIIAAMVIVAITLALAVSLTVCKVNRDKLRAEQSRQRSQVHAVRSQNRNPRYNTPTTHVTSVEDVSMVHSESGVGGKVLTFPGGGAGGAAVSTSSLASWFGKRVEGRWKGGSLWFPGTVTAVCSGVLKSSGRNVAVVDITYDDGDVERVVPVVADRVRSAPPSDDEREEGPATATATATGGRHTYPRDKDDDDDDDKNEVAVSLA